MAPRFLENLQTSGLTYVYGCLPARSACLIAFENGVDHMLASYPLLRNVTRNVAMLKQFRITDPL